MLPFRHLLKPNTPFQWSNELNTLFDFTDDNGLGIFKESVQNWHWVVVDAATLFMRTGYAFLLPEWLENYIGG